MSELLRAVIDCIIPADDYPSASQNRVDIYIERILQTDLQEWQDKFQAGLDELEADSKRTTGGGFASLPPQRQNALLAAMEHDPAWGEWFSMLVQLTNEGYYADRSNGGNPDHASWNMIGYEPRLPPGLI